MTSPIIHQALARLVRHPGSRPWCPVVRQQSDGKVRAEPPVEWGSRWRWNLTEDGMGVYLRKR